MVEYDILTDNPFELLLNQKSNDRRWLMKPLNLRIISLVAILCFGFCAAVIAGTYNHKVYQAQKKLSELGYNPGPADGLWGKKTENALKRYQKENGMPVTGFLDTKVSEKLGLKDTPKKSEHKLIGQIGNIQYRGDTQKAFEFTKILAEYAVERDLGKMFKWFFFYEKSNTLRVFLTPFGDEVYSLGPHAFKRSLRNWAKGAKKMFGGVPLVHLLESDQTIVGEAKYSMWSDTLTVKLY